MNVAENIPWVEKYRPRSISKILEQNEIIQTLKQCIENSLALPHCLFYGPPGTGKTTTALAIAYQLFGPKFFIFDEYKLKRYIFTIFTLNFQKYQKSAKIQ